MDSKSLAKNSSGSLAAVRGLRGVACVDVASPRRRRATARRLGCLRRTFGVGRGRALLIRILLKDLAPHIGAK
jgi:hypothetical protein